MTSPLLLVTGFEPFLDVQENPSALLVEGWLTAPPAGLHLSGGVLPVSIERLPAAYDALISSAPESPAALVAFGVQRDSYFRLERMARAALSSAKADNDGRLADGVLLDGPAERSSSLDLEALAETLRTAGAPDVRISEDAGGYVCERTYYHALQRAEELGVPAIFLHVPPLEAMAIEGAAPDRTRVCSQLYQLGLVEVQRAKWICRPSRPRKNLAPGERLAQAWTSFTQRRSRSSSVSFSSSQTPRVTTSYSAAPRPRITV